MFDPGPPDDPPTGSIQKAGGTGTRPALRLAAGPDVGPTAHMGMRFDVVVVAAAGGEDLEAVAVAVAEAAMFRLLGGSSDRVGSP